MGYIRGWFLLLCLGIGVFILTQKDFVGDSSQPDINTNHTLYIIPIPKAIIIQNDTNDSTPSPSSPLITIDYLKTIAIQTLYEVSGKYGEAKLVFNAPLWNDTMSYYGLDGTIYLAKNFLQNCLRPGGDETMRWVVIHEYCHFVLDDYCDLSYEQYWQEDFCSYYAYPSTDSMGCVINGLNTIGLDKETFIQCFFENCSNGYDALLNCYDLA